MRTPAISSDTHTASKVLALVRCGGFAQVNGRGSDVSLFRYLPPARLDVLLTQSVRYSQPAALNDPFEGKPYYTGFASRAQMTATYAGHYEKIVREQYRSLSDELQDQVTLKDFSILMEHMREEVYGVFTQVESEFVPAINATMNCNFAAKTGVLCFSEVNDSQLMWSHYADNHRGFVVEFDECHPYFTQRGVSQDELWQLHKVKYSDHRPQTTAIELDFDAIFLTKHSSWSYECEWRDFKRLNTAKIVIEAKPLPIYMFELPASAIRSVTLGAMMDADSKNRIRVALTGNERLQHLQIFDAVLDERDYGLTFRMVQWPS